MNEKLLLPTETKALTLPAEDGMGGSMCYVTFGDGTHFTETQLTGLNMDDPIIRLTEKDGTDILAPSGTPTTDLVITSIATAALAYRSRNGYLPR
jgi:hypothetical protein